MDLMGSHPEKGAIVLSGSFIGQEDDLCKTGRDCVSTNLLSETGLQ